MKDFAESVENLYAQIFQAKIEVINSDLQCGACVAAARQASKSKFLVSLKCDYCEKYLHRLVKM